MVDRGYEPVPHDHEEFLARALKRKGFQDAYDDLEDEYLLVRELLGARMRAGLTQEEVARSMGTSNSAISRLEAGGKHSPSVATLQKYAKAVGCDVEIRLLPSGHRVHADSLPRLAPDEADEFAADLDAAREELAQEEAVDPWRS